AGSMGGGGQGGGSRGGMEGTAGMGRTRLVGGDAETPARRRAGAFGSRRGARGRVRLRGRAAALRTAARDGFGGGSWQAAFGGGSACRAALRRLEPGGEGRRRRHDPRDASRALLAGGERGLRATRRPRDRRPSLGG